MAAIIMNSFKKFPPDIIAQWDHLKNGKLALEQVTPGSNRKVWWKCPDGPDHEWQASIYSRASANTGCPYCTGHRVSVTNALAFKFPDVAKQWHPKKNGELKPDQVTFGAKKKVWWKCPVADDHEWEATISNRGFHHSGCPCCAGRQASITNSLASKSQKLSREWHPTHNESLTAKQVPVGSHKKVWWKCPKGPDHEWQASVKARTNSGTGCPFCSGNQVSETNSLAKLVPHVAKQWHPKKNGELKPDQVTFGSHKKVWWKCRKGPDHQWIAPITERTTGHGCPYCSGNRVSVTNSLAFKYPEIATLWDSKKNGKLRPDQFTFGSNTKVWWNCLKGADHQWSTAIKSLTTGHGCPYCAGKRLSTTNSLASKYPEVAAQWHPKRNGKLTPEHVIAGSHDKAWWICNKHPDHVWDAVINSRTSAQSQCPYCAKRISDTDSLASKYPEVAAQWHPSKNGKLLPDHIPLGSAKQVWWKCSVAEDHEWRTKVVSRTTGERKCPCCTGKKVSTTNSLASLYPDVAKEWHPHKNGDLTPELVIGRSNKKVRWICKNEHEWLAACDNRTLGKTDCPGCTTGNRSKMEIYLAFELLNFFNYDVDDRKVVIADKRYEGDIIIREKRLIVEYDAHYWHKGKAKINSDKKKTRILQSAGWIVIRVREHPLRRLSVTDLLVSSPPTIKQISNKVLEKIADVYDIEIEGLKKYLENPDLQNESAAKTFIENLEMKNAK